jgi:hypothetical protein
MGVNTSVEKAKPSHGVVTSETGGTHIFELHAPTAGVGFVIVCLLFGAFFGIRAAAARWCKRRGREAEGYARYSVSAGPDGAPLEAGSLFMPGHPLFGRRRANPQVGYPPSWIPTAHGGPPFGQWVPHGHEHAGPYGASPFGVLTDRISTLSEDVAAHSAAATALQARVASRPPPARTTPQTPRPTRGAAGVDLSNT